MIEIKTNQHEALAAFVGASARTLNKAWSHSANTALSQTRTFILKSFVERGMKRKQLAPRLTVYRANPNKLLARLLDSGKRVPLSAFDARVKKVATPGAVRGGRTRLGVTIMQDGQRSIVPGAFLVQMSSGRMGIFQRVGSARLPIRQLYAPGISKIFNSIDGLPAATQAFARSAFITSFARDLKFYKAKESLL